MMRSRGMMTAFAVLVVLAWAGALEARMSDWEVLVWGKSDISGKMDVTVRMYYDGRLADVSEAMKRLLGEGLADQELIRVPDKLTPTLRAQLVANETTAEATKALLDRVGQAVVVLRKNREYVDSVVSQLGKGGEAAWEASQRCVQLGEYAVPSMVGALAGTDDARLRVTIGNTLVLMGPRAVRPLTEGVWLQDAGAATQVITILGEIRNELALGILGEVLADRSRPSEVRQAAARALAKIHATGTCSVPEQGTPAAYYYVLGNAYLHDAAVTLPTLEGETLPVWSWSDEKKRIEGREVAPALYAPEMAEKNCSAGLRTDRTNTPLRSLLLSSLLAQKLALVGQSAEKAETELKMAILAGGEDALYGSLKQALAQGDAGLAILASRTLGEMTTGKGVPETRRQALNNPLLEGLGYPYRPVRLAAAQALVAQGPTLAQGGFENANLVLPALSWGLMYEMSAKQVLVAHPSDAVTAKYRDLLTAAGYRMSEALGVEAMLAQAAELPKPDVVIMDVSMTDSLRALRTVLMDPCVRVILVGADEETAKACADMGVVAALSTEPTAEALAAALARIPKAAEEAKLVTGLIGNISESSAQALASIDAKVAPYRMSEAVPVLRSALAYESEAILVPVLKALGSIGAGEAIEDVLKVSANSKNPKAVRLAGLQALAAIFESTGEVNPDVFRMLVPMTDEPDGEIAYAASRAVSLAKFDSEQFTDLVLKKRVEDIKAGMAD